MSIRMDVDFVLGQLGCTVSSGDLPVHTPIDGSQIGSVKTASPAEIDAALSRAQNAFLAWRTLPAPRRGELVRRFGNALRDHKADLARLVTIECGKPISEGEGEVQEMIDICDFAVGLSRQLHGLTIASERPGHRMMEQWHPLGPTLIISAFNFPVAVWAWNAALALVCGNSIVWKPSEKTPLTALAVQALLDKVLADFEDAPDGLSQVIIGARDTGRRQRPVLPEPSLNWVATMPRLSATRQISTWRCAVCFFLRSVPAASAAPACADCSCMTRFMMISPPN